MDEKMMTEFVELATKSSFLSKRKKAKSKRKSVIKRKNKFADYKN